MVEVHVAHLGLDRKSGSPVVILQEKGGARVLPIWIGHSEAHAIHMELEGIKYERPLTHDLLKQVIVGLGGELRRVIITTVKENTYFAELHIHRNDEVVHVDSRPSDSIAIALRLKSPIFTSPDLLDHPDTPVGDVSDEGPSLDARKLQDYLKDLDPEDFGKFKP